MFIGDLDPKVNDDILYEIFSQRYSSTNSARVIIDPISKRSKYYGFIKFSSLEEYNNAMVEMDGCYIFNRPIKVNQATKRNSAGLIGKSCTIPFVSEKEFNLNLNCPSINNINNVNLGHRNTIPQTKFDSLYQSQSKSSPCLNITKTNENDFTGVSNSNGNGNSGVNNYNYYNYSLPFDFNKYNTNISSVTDTPSNRGSFGSTASNAGNAGNTGNTGKLAPVINKKSIPQGAFSYYFNYHSNDSEDSINDMVLYSKYGHDDSEVVINES